MRRLVAALFATAAFCIPMFAFADTIQVNFESPTYTAGLNINGQNGWSNTGLYDANVVTSAVANFGSQSLQISDAKTSGSFGDQTFAPGLVNSAGESTANAGTFATGTIQAHFESQFDIKAIAPHSGDILSVSPDRGDGARVSYLRFEDLTDGVHVHFDDVTDVGPIGTVATFNDYDIATLDPSISHTIKFSIDFVNGPANDVVKIYIDGNLAHTGTTWEDYYRYDPEQAGSGNLVPVVRTMLFREKGTANAADLGKGFLIDNLTYTSGPTLTGTTIVVTPSNVQGWVSADTNADGAVNFITDATTLAGTGALQLTTDSSTSAKADYLHDAGSVALSAVTELSYYTKQNSAPFASADPSYQLPVLLNGTTGFTTLVFEPYENGTVVPGTWQHWDVAKGQFWSSRNVTCSNGSVVAGGGGAPFYTLSQIETMCPSAVVAGFGVNIGSNNPSYNVETDLVSFNNTAYDFEPAQVPSTVTVTIDKFIDGVAATTTTVTASFSMQSSWNASNLGGSGSGTYSLGTSDNYEAVTSPMNSGSSYTTNEVSDGTVVGSCSAGAQYSLVGYTTGTSFAAAMAAKPSTTAPNFPNLTSNEYVIVWNTTCAAQPTYKVHITKYLDGVPATAAGANNYLFPMSATWSATNISSGSGNYTLGSGWGTATGYSADTAGMTGPYNYTTSEVTADIDPTSKVVASKAQCVPGDYYLVGYTTSGTSFADAAMQATSTTPIAINGASADQYIIVSNKTCPTTGSLTITKSSIGGNGIFNFTSDIPNHTSFQITTTNNQGSITFDGLTPGEYHVTEVNQPAGWTQTDTSCDDVSLSAGQSQTCVVTDTNNKLLGSIRGSKFEDWDGDSSPFETKWEVGLKGWTIYIDKNNNGQLDPGEQTATTNNSGLYIFSGLPAGTYTIREVQQPGWTQTYPSRNAMSDKWVVTLAAGQNVKKKDFGNFKLGSISGMKYNDLNGDGRKESNEPGLSGWTIKLKGNNGVTLQTVTDQNGNYSFSDLFAGNYKVSEVMQNGWRQTDRPTGTIKIRSAADFTNENFGNTQKQNDHGHDGDRDNDQGNNDN